MIVKAMAYVLYTEASIAICLCQAGVNGRVVDTLECVAGLTVWLLVRGDQQVTSSLIRSSIRHVEVVV